MAAVAVAKMREALGVTNYYQPRSYGEIALMKRGLGDAAADATAESIFGKIVGGLAQVASAVVPAVINKTGGSPTGNATVDQLLKNFSNGNALQSAPIPQPATTASIGGVSVNTLLLIAALGVGGYLVLGKKRGR